MAEHSFIRVVGARQHNLKNISVSIPRNKLTVITGLSGSGKSSLAFDTLHAEGQRRYVEALSASARQYLQQMQKPDVDRIEGLSPTIAIEQRASSSSPRSTVATATELFDYLRLLFARVGVARCWMCGRPIVRHSAAQIVDSVLATETETRIMVMAPLVQEERGNHKKILAQVAREGFVRIRINGELAMLDGLDPLDARRKYTIDVVVDRLKSKAGIGGRLAESVETAMQLSGGRVVIAKGDGEGNWIDESFSGALSCPLHPEVCVEHVVPQLFSFNTPLGACDMCHGLGTTLAFDRDLIVPDRNVSLRDVTLVSSRRQGKDYGPGSGGQGDQLIEDFCARFDVLPDIPFRNIPKHLVDILFDGADGKAEENDTPFEGVIPALRNRWETTESESVKQRLHAYLQESPCEQCRGARLCREALCVKIGEYSIADVASMTIDQASEWAKALSFEGEAATIAEPLLAGLVQRLRFLVDVGVTYLTLDRTTSTLSCGESQRIRLATQIGGELSGVCYVLDEPTIGLHSRDSRRLVSILEKMAALGNTVVVVEHDEEVIARASHVIDIGPGAGQLGGQVVAEGSVDDLRSSDRSITGQFLAGKQTIAVPTERRAIDWQYHLELRNVAANNLKNVTVRLPLGRFVCVTGVSGSGKSSLVGQVLVRAMRRQLTGGGPRPGEFESIAGAELVDKIIEIDQSPIGRTPRSNPATYVGVLDLVRQLYAQTREAKIRGYGPARFSFNVKGGRCEHCQGQGTKRISMHFLPDVYVTCQQCGGKRYGRETLEVRYRGKTIADVLDMSVEEAGRFFENFANVHGRLRVLREVGLGYITLGQAANTLSGGEAQRIKLASELHRTAERHGLYVLDEPTTGLHPADVRKLLSVLNRLVDHGHTVLVIEHNLDVIKVADWVIDLGPEGGQAGGYVVVEGTPEQVAACQNSITGRFLKRYLAATVTP